MLCEITQEQDRMADKARSLKNTTSLLIPFTK